jgi:hypothetical protein
MKDERRAIERLNSFSLITHPSDFLLALLRCFGDLARLDATGADLHALRSAVGELNAYGLQVGIEATRGPIIRVGNIIAELGAFATDFATFSHDYLNTSER